MVDVDMHSLEFRTILPQNPALVASNRFEIGLSRPRNFDAGASFIYRGRNFARPVENALGAF
jgi:hypothetical protein